MKLSLPLRIFFIQFVFMVALGAFASFLVKRAFESYEEAWEQEIGTLAAEKLFSPLASELARSLLLRLEGKPPEPQEQVKRDVGAGLDKVLPQLPSIERLLILDGNQGVQYANKLAPAELSFAEQSYANLLPTEQPIRREVLLRSGDEIVELLIPVFDYDPDLAVGEQETRFLGTVVIHYRPDVKTDARLRELYPEIAVGSDADGRRPAVTAVMERLFNPWATEMARALLVEIERDDTDEREAFSKSVSDGLNKIMDALPMEKLVIVDRERRIQYANDAQYLDLAFTGGAAASLFDAESLQREPVTLDSGEQGMAIMLPVFDPPGEDRIDNRRRLGSVLVHYRPDPGLTVRLPQLKKPSVGPRDYIQPLLLFLSVAVGSGILLAGLTGLPVRRMERAMREFRARGFRGGLDPRKAGIPSYLAPAVQTISEMGGQLEALDAQGKEREALLETLSQTLEDAMIAVDPSGVPLAWNRAALRLLTQGLSDVTDDDERRNEEAQQLVRALERNTDLKFALAQEGLARTREVELVAADGSRIPGRLTHVPLEVRPGISGTLLLIRDLAALRKVETHLLDAGRFAILAHLAAGMAHEIRNPLHSIQINAGVVEQYAGRIGTDRESRAVVDSLNTIKDEAQRLTDLLNNYLGMVRQGDDFGPVDLRQISERVIQLVNYAARKSDVEIRVEGEEHPPLIHGVANRLQQAILNLVLNAIQAMPDGGTVTLRIVSLGSVVRVTVADTGPGLPQDLSDQLFDTRVTTKAGGSGLGLPLVRMITEAHGGGVWYRSEPGKGAAFTLVLPVPLDLAQQ